MTDLDGRYQFIYVVDNAPTACDPLLVIISVDSQPAVMIASNVSRCNAMSNMGDNCIDLNMQVSGAVGIWSVDPTFPNDASDITNICFDGIDPGESFDFEFLVPNNNLVCDEVLFTMPILVTDCSCPNINISAPDDICEGAVFEFANIQDPNIVPGSWEIDDPSIMIVGGGAFLGVIPGTFTLTYTPDDPGDATCMPFSSVTLTVVPELSAGAATDLSLIHISEPTRPY